MCVGDAMIRATEEVTKTAMARARLIGSGTARPVGGDWGLAAVVPGSAQMPRDLAGLAPDWIPCSGPMPVAAALRAAGRWDLEHPRDFDAEEWWYRCRFTALATDAKARLRFEGLATIADVWLNGTHILKSESMFAANVVDVSGVLAANNELFLRFRALAPLLAMKRPRPQRRTRMVTDQQLRWHRTAVLGRAAGWCPPAAPVGPWRPVLLQTASPLGCEEADIQVGLQGEDGLVRLTMPLAMGSGQPRRGAMRVGESSGPVTLGRTADGQPAIQATVCVPNADRWWPHTHGGQPLYPVQLSVDIGNCEFNLDLGRVGFRSMWLDRDTDGEGFGLVVNGVPVFCRGACWTPLDLARLDARAADYRAALERLRDAGMNMLRVGGTMVYETDTFHDLCDELGILVWQDFMFANMDYPSSDESFLRNATIEARQLLRRAQGRPSSVVFCGSSEIEQQVAMLGLPAERARNPLFEDVLPSLVRSLIPDAAWVPSTPSGGLFPFHTDRGVSHYYGVGAYLRPFDDTRRANVRFAAECLAFSNVPDATMTDGLLAEGVMPGHHPRWKTAVPRDAGSGWDFEDVRDHYVRLLFGVDPSELRARDPERYLALGRVTTGEAMLRTFAEWRRPGSSCRGGLVWFARDLIPGAGWGVVDSTGRYALGQQTVCHRGIGKVREREALGREPHVRASCVVERSQIGPDAVVVGHAAVRMKREQTA